MTEITQVNAEQFKDFQLDAGVLVKALDVDKIDFENTDIICTTTGGVQINITPTYSNFYEDVDNAMNFKEGLHLDETEYKLSTTALNTSAENLKLSIGAADIDESTGKVTPRNVLKQDDFTNLYWVGKLMGGGAAICEIKNALSSGGLSLQTNKNSKGQLSIELTCYPSIETQDEPPMAFYVKKSVTEASA